MNNTDMQLSKLGFDSVVFLTWSDWFNEPRSNRFHYASRFARQLPVYFVQPDSGVDSIQFEKVEDFDITVVRVPLRYAVHDADFLQKALDGRGTRRPLLWIYNVFFEEFICRSFAPLKILHATEDYFAKSNVFPVSERVRSATVRILPYADLVVGVSEGVTESYIDNGRFNGAAITLENGCDFNFWEKSGAKYYQPPPDGKKVALYQGNLNGRVDYDLLNRVAESLPDWDFWFCGHVVDSDSWRALGKNTNVKYFGVLDSDGIAELARQSLVGLIPFVQERLIKISLPLKAYEYVACGLPVVSVPIDALEAHDDIFAIETSAKEFSTAIAKVANTRTDPTALALRSIAAKKKSYDHYFSKLCDEIGRICTDSKKVRKKGNVVMFYDDRWTFISTIEEHLTSFQRYSKHTVWYSSGAGPISFFDDKKNKLELSPFDAVIIHYSVRLSLEDHISPQVAEAIAAYGGPKLLFIQDEYENTETARQWIKRLGIDAVFTNVPLDQIESVYPKRDFGHVDFIPTLTGYVPESGLLESFVQPISERSIIIGYRGRCLPFQYGKLAQEKYQIGVEMKRLAEGRGLPVDIEVDEDRRIYGNDWYRFLGSCRATLGTESGSNVFDDIGSLKKLADEHKNLTFDEFHDRFLKGRDGVVRMNQISPKIFESIRLKTALVLFEGSYSGVVKPHAHYIPLKKDFSNIDDVLSKLSDLEFLKAMTDRAYEDVISSGRYSYATFVDGVDAYIDRRMPRDARVKMVSTPWIAAHRDGTLETLWQSAGMGGLTTNLILGGYLTRENVSQRGNRDSKPSRLSEIRDQLIAKLYGLRFVAHLPRPAYLIARLLWKAVPARVRQFLVYRYDL